MRNTEKKEFRLGRSVLGNTEEKDIVVVFIPRGGGKADPRAGNGAGTHILEKKEGLDFYI